MIEIAGQSGGGAEDFTVVVLEQDLDVLVNAMKTLSAFFPLSGKLYSST